MLTGNPRDIRGQSDWESAHTPVCRQELTRGSLLPARGGVKDPNAQRNHQRPRKDDVVVPTKLGVAVHDDFQLGPRVQEKC